MRKNDFFTQQTMDGGENMEILIIVLSLLILSLEIYLIPLMQYIDNAQNGQFYTDISAYITIFPYNIALSIPAVIIVLVLIRLLVKKLGNKELL